MANYKNNATTKYIDHRLPYTASSYNTNSFRKATMHGINSIKKVDAVATCYDSKYIDNPLKIKYKQQYDN